VSVAPAQDEQCSTQLADDAQNILSEPQRHLPSWQTWLGAQATPHAPQFAASEDRSTHEPLQRVGLASPQPLTHWNPPPELGAHAGVGSAHAAPHAPQSVLVDKLVLHPRSAPHWAQPGSQAPLTAQDPPTHWTSWGSTWGRAVQSLAQAPQFRTLVCRSTHADPQIEVAQPPPGASTCAPGVAPSATVQGGSLAPGVDASVASVVIGRDKP